MTSLTITSVFFLLTISSVTSFLTPPSISSFSRLVTNRRNSKCHRTLYHRKRKCDPRPPTTTTQFHALNSIEQEQQQNLSSNTPSTTIHKYERSMLALGSTLGLTLSEASQFLNQYPELYLQLDSLASKLLYFQTEVGIPKSQLKLMILRHPALISAAFMEPNLKTTIDILRLDLNCTSAEVWNLATQSFPQIVRLNRSELRKRLAFYRHDLNLTHEELKKFVLSQPKNLQTSTRGMRAAIEILQSELNCTLSEIKTMMLKFPCLLTYNPTANVRPTVRFLLESDVGMGLALLEQRSSSPPNTKNCPSSQDVIVRERVKTILLRFPNVIGFSISNNLNPTIRFFRTEVGCTLHQFGKIVWRLPELLGFSIQNNLRPKLHCFQTTLNITSRDELTNLITRNPTLFSLSLERNLIPKLDYFGQFLTTEELRRFVVERPQTLSLNLERNLMPKMEFLAKEFSSKRELKAFLLEKPGQLTYNLQGRIMPRVEILKKNGIELRDAPVTIISRSDGSFEKWISRHSKTG